MLNLLLDEMTKFSERWVERADLLVELGAEGNARTVRSMLSELHGIYDRIKAKTARLSVEQYATQHGVQPDTVRRWVRSGQLPAAKSADGSWSIPYGATRRKLRKVA